MNNIPQVKCGIVAVSRDCFPVTLSQTRRQKVGAACTKQNMSIFEAQTVVENETDACNALQELRDNGVNALVVYLGNFGPEGPETLLAQKFDGPVMFVAAAEESADDLVEGRGDAFCGMLNASYNIGLRGLRPYIPEYPVATPDEVARLISRFVPIARVILGLSKVKVFSFGPRPQDFFACNAPIKPLFDLGVEIMENSELDLYDIYMEAGAQKERIESVAADMKKELGPGNSYPDLLPKLAQYEIALSDFMEQNLGSRQFGIFANKCWPSFEKYFNFVPCFVNSRLASRGIPVACEVDIYGALSEYIATCATNRPATLLDLNNTVPQDMLSHNGIAGYAPTDLFMGFHCGNTAKECLSGCTMKFQRIMHRLMEPSSEPDITRGTLEGTIASGPVTLLRLQATADASLRAYCAEGEVLDVDPRSFGCIGVFAVKEMGRFYRHVLIQKRFPHHGAVAFAHTGHTFFEVMKMCGVADIGFNQPSHMRYPGENPFS